MKRAAAPRTLIQIHYHDHPGGVTRVMGEYARTFAALSTGTVRNVILCAHAQTVTPQLPPEIVCNCPAMGYRRFRVPATFNTARKAILRRLKEVITDGDMRHPIAVIGHNMTLGKNLALSAAFADCARELGSQQICFYSMVHDLAEEGRTDMLRNIDALEKVGIPIRALMYCRLPHLTYVVLNPRVEHALNSAGLAVRRMINAVTGSTAVVLSGAARKKISTWLERIAGEDGTMFYCARPTVFYPSRIVPRKNMAEAILVSCVLNQCNLVTGAPGQSPADRAMHKKLLAFCRRHRLPVVFGFDRVPPLRKGSLLAMLYAYSHCSISTSTLEGFGFGLYEPWLFDRAVAGRVPVGFINPRGFDVGLFYRSLPVLLTDSQLRQVVDFAELSLNDQLKVMGKILGDSRCTSCMIPKAANVALPFVSTQNIRRTIVRNAGAVTRAFGVRAFSAAFKRVFMSPMAHQPGPVRISEIQNSL